MGVKVTWARGDIRLMCLLPWHAGGSGAVAGSLITSLLDEAVPAPVPGRACDSPFRRGLSLTAFPYTIAADVPLNEYYVQIQSDPRNNSENNSGHSEFQITAYTSCGNPGLSDGHLSRPPGVRAGQRGLSALLSVGPHVSGSERSSSSRSSSCDLRPVVARAA